MDMTIRSKLPFLKQLFNVTASYSNKPYTKDRYISFYDYKQLLSVAELFPDLINET